MKEVDSQLKQYIEQQILPRYEHLDKAHGLDHVGKVIGSSLEIAEDYDVEIDLVYTIAAYHDLGNIQGREQHHILSGVMLSEDETLQRWFTPDQIEVMRMAVEDHRASGGYEPRSIYGKIVSEADRQIDPEDILFRTILYSLKHFPDYTALQHFERTYDHILNKYGEDGYLTLWLSTRQNNERLAVLREWLKDKDEMRRRFTSLYQQEQGNV